MNDKTGILADKYGENVNFGIFWDRIKDQVMKPGASEDYIIVSIFLNLTAFRLDRAHFTRARDT